MDSNRESLEFKLEVLRTMLKWCAFGELVNAELWINGLLILLLVILLSLNLST